MLKIIRIKEGTKKNEVKLTDNEIGAEGAKELSGLLSVNTILTELDLRSDLSI